DAPWSIPTIPFKPMDFQRGASAPRKRYRVYKCHIPMPVGLYHGAASYTTYCHAKGCSVEHPYCINQTSNLFMG
ncbi:MAG: hypothetical protein K2N91_09065, partial [Muribaculaceae bacterium]|nr:hypothetical protein [Muribaculaceae bacterium]